MPANSSPINERDVQEVEGVGRGISAESLAELDCNLAHGPPIPFTTMKAVHTDLENDHQSFDIALVVPWYGGSHKSWADAVVRYSRHHVRLVSHPAEHWRWRIAGGPVTLAEQLEVAYPGAVRPDVVVVSSLTDVSALCGLARHVVGEASIVVYQHESQLLYPRSPHQSKEPADEAGSMAEWRSMVASDEVWFNSAFHRNAYLNAAKVRFTSIATTPGHEHLIDGIAAKASVLPVAVEMADIVARPLSPTVEPLVLFNQRWDDDKRPGAVMAALDDVARSGAAFRVALAGPRSEHARRPRLGAALSARVVHDESADRSVYAQLLHAADVVVSDAVHEFFGVSIVEAIAAGCVPILPARQNYPNLVAGLPRFLHHGHDLVPRLRATLDSLSAPTAELTTELAKIMLLARSHEASLVIDDFDRRINRLAR